MIARIAAALVLARVSFAQERPDLAVVDRIKAEAFQRSQVMETLYAISDANGPRLTASPGFDKAASWAVARLKSFGVEDARIETWGPFGRAWTLKQYSLETIEPYYANLTATPLAWSRATDGTVTGDIVLAPLRATPSDGPDKLNRDWEEYKRKWTGKLRGKIVLLNEPQAPGAQTAAPFHRYTDAELTDIVKAPEPSLGLTARSLSQVQFPETRADIAKLLGRFPPTLRFQWWAFEDKFEADKGAFFAKEGALAVLKGDQRGRGGSVASENAGGWATADALAPPTFDVTVEHYNRIARTAEKNNPLRLRLNLQAEISGSDLDGTNVIGEIRGSVKPNEVVMLGAHFDSWHMGAGAADNAAGSAVMIEAMRVLKALGLKLDRTVRIALWSGEEQGLFGSRAYVKKHFADPGDMKPLAEYAGFSAYYNLDAGSGKIRGIRLQSNDAARPYLESWFSPFRDLGASTVSIRDAGGTDHLSFE